MKTQSERKSEFRAIALASGFLHEAEKLGLTPALLQRLRESPIRMKEFVRLAEAAEAEHVDRIMCLEIERECAFDFHGVHYHVVPVTCKQLEEWGFQSGGMVSDAVKIARRHDYEPLCEEAYPTVSRILAAVPPGQWIGASRGDSLAYWERTDNEVTSKGSYGDFRQMSLSHFPELRGMVFMWKFVECDYNPTHKQF